MRRALAIALTTLAAPGVAQAANPYNATGLSSSPVLDKALIAHQRASEARDRAAQRRARAASQSTVMPAYLAAIAACESGGNPQAVGGGGLYRGLFQMTYAAWASVGGEGDPAAAPVAEQIRRAEMLYAQSGPGQWPVCGH